jgi:hypothetical protein
VTLAIHAGAVAAGQGDELTQLQDAIILQLQGLKRRSGAGYLQAIEPYNGEFDEDEATDDFLQALHGRAPAVLVRMAMGNYEQFGNAPNQTLLRQNVDLLLISLHMRSFVSRGSGDLQSASDPTQDPGTLSMVKDIRDALLGTHLQVAGFHQARPKSHLPIAQSKSLNVLLFSWEFDFRLVHERKARGPVVRAESVEHRHSEANEPDVLVAKGITE